MKNQNKDILVELDNFTPSNYKRMFMKKILDKLLMLKYKSSNRNTLFGIKENFKREEAA